MARKPGSRTTRIIHKNETCNCGCHGQDPWHRASYERVIRDLRVLTTEAEAVVWASAENRYFVELAEGWAQFPWGRSRVVQKAFVFDGHIRSKAWQVDQTDYRAVAYDGQPSSHPGAAAA